MKQRIAVLFGGQSSEHSISCLSAAGVLGAIDRERFDVIAVGISRSGRWFQVSDQPADWQLRGKELPGIPESGTEIRLVSSARAPLAATAGEAGAIVVDVAFPVLHGNYGEDGTIQGALEIMGIPYVGSGVLAAAAGMDKQATKVFLQAAGLPVGSYRTLTRGIWQVAQTQILADIESLILPVFVKPARAGSSVGITKVKKLELLAAAIEIALEHDDKVIVEQSVEQAREIECAVLQNPDGVGANASQCAEIIVDSQHEFYDFDAKYLSDSAELIVPAELPQELHSRLGAAAIKAFEALGARGLSRVDFFVLPNGEFVINEVNTMPGFTPISLYPRMCEHAGVSYSELVSRLIELALIPVSGPR